MTIKPHASLFCTHADAVNRQQETTMRKNINNYFG